MKPIAFVTPWYGSNIQGGAETLCREVVKHLQQSNTEMEILTTCVKEFLSDWNTNFFNTGECSINCIKVRRFPVSSRNAEKFDKVNYKLINNIPVTQEEESIFFDEMINSPSLYRYINENYNKYHCFVFIPYMFGTTYKGTMQCKGKNILIPCIHDESYAYMKPIKEMMENAAGLIFNSKAEFDLAKKIYRIDNIKSEVIGMGIDPEPFKKSNPDRFRKKYNIDNKFILYAGRKEKGKNVDELLEFFIKYKESSKRIDVKLIFIGGGNIFIPNEYKSEIIDLGFIPVEDKYDAYSAASIFCNPSKNESFSIVLMESWLAGIPVIVNGWCEVTKNFCLESNAGLYYTNRDEFFSTIDLLLTDENLSKAIGQNGKSFVINNFSWEIIIERYKRFFEKTFYSNHQEDAN